MRKYLITFIVMLLVLSLGSPAYAGNPNILESARQSANSEILDKFGYREYFIPKDGKGRSLNEAALVGWGVLCYGSAHGDNKGGSHRYLGYTINGVSFTNPSFPDDAGASTGYLEENNWIKHPWHSVKVEDFLIGMKELPLDWNSKFNSHNSGNIFLENIRVGLDIHWGKGRTDANGNVIVPGKNRILGDKCTKYWNNWHEYVYVLSPPTDHTWGMGRMWYINPSGQVRYATVPMAPNIMGDLPDFYTKFDKFHVIENQGNEIELVITFGLKPGHSKDEIAILKAFHVVGNEFPLFLEPLKPSDALDSSGSIVFKPGEEKKYKVRVTAQARNSIVRSNITPVEGMDANWSDNTAECSIFVIANPPNNSGVDISEGFIGWWDETIRYRWNYWICCGDEECDPCCDGPGEGYVSPYNRVYVTYGVSGQINSGNDSTRQGINISQTGGIVSVDKGIDVGWRFLPEAPFSNYLDARSVSNRILGVPNRSLSAGYYMAPGEVRITITTGIFATSIGEARDRHLAIVNSANRTTVEMPTSTRINNSKKEVVVFVDKSGPVTNLVSSTVVIDKEIVRRYIDSGMCKWIGPEVYYVVHSTVLTRHAPQNTRTTQTPGVSKYQGRVFYTDLREPGSAGGRPNVGGHKHTVRVKTEFNNAGVGQRLYSSQRGNASPFDFAIYKTMYDDIQVTDR